MRIACAAVMAVIMGCAFGRQATADCPVVMLSGSAQIQPSNCGPIVYNGGSSATLTLPGSAWHGMVVNESGAAITLVGAGGAPVNEVAAGVSLPSNTGGNITGDPAAGWHYSGPTGSFGGTPGGTSGQLQINS